MLVCCMHCPAAATPGCEPYRPGSHLVYYRGRDQQQQRHEGAAELARMVTDNSVLAAAAAAWRQAEVNSAQGSGALVQAIRRLGLHSDDTIATRAREDARRAKERHAREAPSVQLFMSQASRSTPTRREAKYPTIKAYPPPKVAAAASDSRS